MGRKKSEKKVEIYLPLVITAPLLASITDSLPPPSKQPIKKKYGNFFSNMRPSIGDQHLHLINQTFLPMLIIVSILLHPLLHRLLHCSRLDPRRHNPPPKPILPYPPYACSKTGIYIPTMDGLVCRGPISDTNVWV